MRGNEDIQTPGRRARPPLLAALLVALCALAVGAWAAAGAGAQQNEQPEQPRQQRPPVVEEPRITPPEGGEKPPNLVVIQTDDQTLESLYDYIPVAGAKLHAMPTTLREIAGKGVTFNNYHVPYPLCCPSRVSLLTGRYSHNNNVRGNVPPNGGYFGFSFRPAASHNIATWLQSAGYRTIHLGKFLNGYGDLPYSDGSEVPPGWDRWYSLVQPNNQAFFYGYSMNVNGEIQGPFGEQGTWEPRRYTKRDDRGCPFEAPEGEVCNHVEDKLSNIARAEMLDTPDDQPFYLQVDYPGPHGDYRAPAGPEPATRYYNWFKQANLPSSYRQGFDEVDVSDKPRFIREAERLEPRDRRLFRIYYQKSLESLRTIDDGVKLILDTLRGMRELDNTYVIFTSDNGYFFGEHRLLGGKFLAYEPGTHLPLLIRGPGIEAGVETDELAANIDIAPTLLELAGAKADRSIDGRSLIPYMEDPDERTLRAVLFESFVETADVEAGGAITANNSAGAGGSATVNDRSSPGDPSVAAAPSSASASSAVEPAARGSARRRGGEAGASLLAPPKDYVGIRIGDWKYIAWPSGEKELYNLNYDPDELRSLHLKPNFFPIRNYMHRQLKRLLDCVGRECRETMPKIPMTRREFSRFQAEKRREIRKKEIERERQKRQREREKRRRERQQQRQR